MPLLDKRIVNTQTTLKQNGYKLYPYQINGLGKMLKHEKGNYGGILGDEMGLGKTLQMISLIIANPKKITLVIVPANLILQWKSEIEKFAPHIAILIHWNKYSVNLSEVNQLKNDYNIILTTYHYAYKYELFKIIKIDRVICDEAHIFRNNKSKTYKGLEQFKTKIKWCITGTPIQNYLKDIKTLINFILPNIKLNKTNIPQFITTLLIRRTKSEVNINLPERINKLQFISFSSIQEQKLYDKLDKLQHEFGNIKLLEKQLRLRQICSIPKNLSLKFKIKYKTNQNIESINNTKLNYIVKLIKKNTKEKPIVFTHFNAEINYLKYKLEKENISTGVINGSVSQEERQSVIHNDSYKVLLIQIVAGGTGLNLQHFNSVYFTSPNWNPSLENQAIARVHRIGQKNNVIIRKLIMGNMKTHTIEKRILKIQKDKQKLISTFIKN